MEVLIDRKWKKPDYVIGQMFIDGNYVCDTLEDCDRGLDQSMNEITIRRDKIYGKTAIPTGRYKIDMNTISSRFGKVAFYKEICDGKVPRIMDVKGFDGILIHCLTPETEILTEYGWQNFYSFKENTPLKCYSYNTENNYIELTDINSFIENQYDGILYSCNGRRINYEVTDKHNMWVGSRKRNGIIEWSFRHADSIVKQSYFMTSGIKNGGWDITDKQKILYRIIMAVQADGYILNWSNTASQVKFHFVKERKINRITKLISEFGGSYKIFVDSESKTHICLDNKTSELITEIMNPYRMLNGYKELPMELLNLKPEDLKDLVFEYLFWDGRYENYLRNDKNIVITSTNLNTLNLLQIMCVLSGIRAYLKKESGSDKKKNYCYDLVLYQNQSIVTPESYTYSTKKYNGIVWCLSNKNHTLIIRKNGRTMIIGNCGNTASDSSGCVLLGQNKAKGKVLNSRVTFKKVYDILKNAHDAGEEIWLTIK